MRTRRLSPRASERISTLPAPIATRPKPASSGRPIPASIPADLRNQFAIGEGVITGSVRASGMLSSPLEVAAKADLDELEVTLKDTRIKLQRSATLDVSPDRITAEHVDLVVGQTTRVQMAGTLATTVAAAPLRLQANGPLADLIAIAGPLLPPETRISADGTLSLDLSVAGTIRAPEPSGSLTVRAATAGYGDLPPATDVALTATVDRTRVVLQTLGATWQTARLSAQGLLPLRLLPAQIRSGSSVAVAVALYASRRASLSFAQRARHRHHPRRAPALSDAGHDSGGRGQDGALDHRRGRCARARTRARDRPCSTRQSSRWPAFRSNRWFPRDCGFRTVTHRLPICTGIRSATPSALPGARTLPRRRLRSMWPSTVDSTSVSSERLPPTSPRAGRHRQTSP